MKKAALLVGINAFTRGSGLPALRFAVNDAQRGADVLRRVCRFKSRALVDKDATRENILAAIDQYTKMLCEDDTFLLALCTHGKSFMIADFQRHYYAAYDSVGWQHESLIERDDLHERLKRIPCRSQILLLDTCRPLATRDGNGLRPLPDPAREAARLVHSADDPGRSERQRAVCVVSACQSGQSAHEEAGLGNEKFKGHGLFMGLLLQEIESGEAWVTDGPDSQILEMRSLTSRVQNAITGWEYAQTPVYSQEGAAEAIVLARRRTAQKSRRPPPKRTGRTSIRKSESAKPEELWGAEHPLANAGAPTSPAPPSPPQILPTTVDRKSGSTEPRLARKATSSGSMIGGHFERAGFRATTLDVFLPVETPWVVDASKSSWKAPPRKPDSVNDQLMQGLVKSLPVPDDAGDPVPGEAVPHGLDKVRLVETWASELSRPSPSVEAAAERGIPAPRPTEPVAARSGGTRSSHVAFAAGGLLLMGMVVVGVIHQATQIRQAEIPAVKTPSEGSDDVAVAPAGPERDEGEAAVADTARARIDPRVGADEMAEPRAASMPPAKTEELSTTSTEGGKKAILYEEPVDLAAPDAVVTAVDAAVTWKFINNGPYGPGVQADIAVPDRNMKFTVSFYQNDDDTLPASHLVEIATNVTGRFFGSVPRIVLKPTEGARGQPLVGAAVKVTDGLFWIALSADKNDIAANLSMIRGRNWIDLPFVYEGGQRGILTFEKGPDGEVAFEKALAAWATD